MPYDVRSKAEAGHLRFEVDAAFADVITALRDATFRRRFDEALGAVPYEAFRWETPPVTRATADRPFECVVLDSPELLRRADPSAFEAHFDGGAVATFPNLGGDAVLVVPEPLGPDTSYAHFAEFLRNAPDAQRDALYVAIADAFDQRLDERPLWLNTAGAGVPWLHVRLDDRPKYYRHAPFER